MGGSSQKKPLMVPSFSNEIIKGSKGNLLVLD